MSSFGETTAAGARRSYLLSKISIGDLAIGSGSYHPVDGSPANARKSAAKYGYAIPILIDNGITPLCFGQRGIPYNVIVDPEGMISSARPGYIEWQELHRLLIDAGARLEKD